MKDEIQADNEYLNRFIQKYLPQTVEPKYKYWKHKNRIFAYTSEKIEHKGKMRYIAFIRKELISKRRKNSKIWKLVKKVGFAKRKLAKKRAYEWYNAYVNEKSLDLDKTQAQSEV